MDAISDRVVRMLRAEFGGKLQGVLLVGSRAHGTPRPMSDWDFFVLIDAARRQRRLMQVDGAEVELFINPVSQVRKEFAAWQMPATIDMFAHGAILEDPSSKVTELQEEALRLWQAGPPTADPTWLAFWRYGLCDLLKDVQDLLDSDRQSAEWLMGKAVHDALTGHCRTNRRWLPQQKYLLDVVWQWDPEAAREARSVLDSRRPVEDRARALRTLADRVLEPVGGWLDSWESEWDPVEDPA